MDNEREEKIVKNIVKERYIKYETTPEPTLNQKDMFVQGKETPKKVKSNKTGGSNARRRRRRKK
tara:strand:+ start:639 stop:830 length:192 start_codon:yes stop_codon:yes gene_type:complete